LRRIGRCFVWSAGPGRPAGSAALGERKTTLREHLAGNDGFMISIDPPAILTILAST
jgi:hypothetical protein